MGVIKGSEQALDCARRCLDRLSYEGLSHRSQSTFSRQRSEIYSIFESFLKQKRERNHYDSADRQVLGIPGRDVLNVMPFKDALDFNRYAYPRSAWKDRLSVRITCLSSFKLRVYLHF